MSHALARCLFSELGMANRISPRDFVYMDLLCDQLYFDWLGHGINGKMNAR